MYSIARALQFAGLLIVPFAVLMQVSNANFTLKQSLATSAFGVVLFLLGYVLQSVSRR